MSDVKHMAGIDPCYLMERARLLANIMCSRGLERRGFDTRPRGWHEIGSKCQQRDLAVLRARWAGHRTAKAKGGAT